MAVFGNIGPSVSAARAIAFKKEQERWKKQGVKSFGGQTLSLPQGLNQVVKGLISPGTLATALEAQNRVQKALDTKPVTPGAPKYDGVQTPTDVEFNLPPHKWSLPLDPNVLDFQNNVTAPHAQRRGRMWLFSDFMSEEGSSINGSATPNTVGESGKSVSGISRRELISRSTIPKGTKARHRVKESAEAAFYKPAGFQFLWNPESIAVDVQSSMEIVPDAGDRFRSVVGIYPSQEHVVFSLVLDRTNDFACGYNQFTGNVYNPVAEKNVPIDIKSLAANFTQKGYYTGGYNQGADTQLFETKLKNLFEYGTMHDIEYIFRMINAGTLVESKSPANPLGRKTYDVGYLYPAMVAVEFGPVTTELRPLSYVGWLQSISVRHIAFNTNMVPLRSEISFNIWVFTGSGLTTNN
jgi:hypothetical protein